MDALNAGCGLVDIDQASKKTQNLIRSPIKKPKVEETDIDTI